MVQNRVLPCLLVQSGKLVKTTQFKNPQYVGDPVNAVKIFNEKEVDELMLCDISPDRHIKGPDMELIRKVADECFMPLTYGGGISHLDQIREILKAGVEKVVINSALAKGNSLVTEGAAFFGNQCIVVSMDVKKNWLGRYKVYFHSGQKESSFSPQEFLMEMIEAGAGEIIINNIDLEGSWKGLDLEMLKKMNAISSVPLIASGGAGNLVHIKEVFEETGVSAVALGSMAVYQQQGLGVLINFPKAQHLKEIRQERAKKLLY
ncbi:MAG: imidazole glycerol phosphate synthase subunit HisF [Saprospiraceae bacterium]|nr:imidazole glycerol phosphate synthase subunit HisF [Saprospiraceae bacterium]MBK7788063.1 imidazole glycerol phosphate synthase subunit HisF [Saprospiraceae bacterium]MBK8851922.1 imidazole glycerol phosphate synthase subunit HisF [Saprospiraceae bacterium]MBK9686571.1 imidazole glycerol phosphate synthase subunit HisF [Saprospiraceae bacterium]